MKISICWLTAAIIFLFAAGCSREDTDNEDGPVFNVQEEFLGEEYTNASKTWSFRLPAGWSPLTAEEMDAFEEGIAPYIESYPYQFSIRNIYLSPKTGSFAYIASLPLPPEEAADVIQKEGQDTYSSIAYDTFPVNRVEVTQFRLSTPDLVDYRLIFQVSDMTFQIDYVLPRSTFDEEIRKLESSIGTLETLR
ncbi:MAG: hypothetical protein ACLFST_15150 [Spirochaetia bacterium]